MKKDDRTSTRGAHYPALEAESLQPLQNLGMGETHFRVLSGAVEGLL